MRIVCGEKGYNISNARYMIQLIKTWKCEMFIQIKRDVHANILENVHIARVKKEHHKAAAEPTCMPSRAPLACPAWLLSPAS
jgi:hypothetical protein